MRVGPGTLTSTLPFEFVTKFVFNYNPVQNTHVGSIQGSVTSATPAYLVIYDDEPFSWNQMLGVNNVSLCWAMKTRSSGGPAKMKWQLSPNEKIEIKLNIMEHLRPRIWYVAIIADTCSSGSSSSSSITDKLKLAQRRSLLGGDVVVTTSTSTTNSVLKNVPVPTTTSSNSTTVIAFNKINFVGGAESLGSSVDNSGRHGGSGGGGLGRLHVDLTFVNDDQGWQRQFGFDEFGILPGTLILLCVYVVLFSWQMYTEKNRMKRVEKASKASAQRRHRNSSSPVSSSSSSSGHTTGGATPLVRVWSFLVLFQICSILLRTLDMISYASTGATATRWHWGRAMTMAIFAHSLDLMCRLGMTMAVFLVARGWTITSGPGEVRGKQSVLTIFCVTCLVEVIGHVWISLTYDPSKTNYGYDSTAGSVVVVWRVVQLLWFASNIAHTYLLEIDPKRQTLYMVFGLVFSLWFLSLPGVVLTVNHFIAAHWRYKIVRGTIDLIHFIALASYGVIFWPTWSSHFFETRGSPGSIEEQNQLLGIVEVNHRGSPSWSFDFGRGSRRNIDDDGL